MLTGLLWLVSCGPAVPEPPESDCAIRRPQVGEVRAKQIVCADEIPMGGEAKLGDWLLENHRVRLTIRNQPNRLTQLDGGGGTIIDLELIGKGDNVVEIVPTLDTEWPDSIQISAAQNAIELTAQDGTHRTWTYSLAPETGELRLSGATGFTVVPSPGSRLIGSWLHTGTGLVIAGESHPSDQGGWLHWESNSLWLGTSRNVTTDTHPTAQVRTFDSDASHIEIRIGENLMTRAPTSDSTVTHEFPDNAEVRGVKDGHTPTDWVSAATGTIDPIGAGGFINVAPIAPNGTPIPFMVEWNETLHPIAATGGTAAVGPEPGSGLITAGPKHTDYEIPYTEITGQVELEAELEPRTEMSAWVAFGIPAAPGPKERRTAAEVLLDLGAQGFDYAILTATDEIAQPAAADDAAIPHHAGSRSGGTHGSVYAWPWSANSKAAAHGAAPWTELSPHDLLGWMSKAGRRYTAVDSDWLMNAGDLASASVSPDLLFVRTIDDIDEVAQVFDNWNAIGLVGSSTWVSANETHRDALMRALIEGRGSPSTGPKIALNINGLEPGDAALGADEATPAPNIASIGIDLAGDLTTVRLVGPGAETIAEWSVSELPATTDLPDMDWVLAVAEGENDWAMTSPIWLRQP